LGWIQEKLESKSRREGKRIFLQFLAREKIKVFPREMKMVSI
jgi:hypothetical protein